MKTAIKYLICIIFLLTPITSYAISGRAVYPDGHACNADDECIPGHTCCNNVCQESSNCDTENSGSTGSSGPGGGSPSGGATTNTPSSTNTTDPENSKNPNTKNIEVKANVKTDLATDNTIPSFTDLETHWSKEFVKNLAQQNVVHGYPDSHFYPDVHITRAELLKIAMRAFNIKNPEVIEHKPFDDVPFGEWYTLYITGAKENGIVQGYVNGKYFYPNNPVTRSEALKIIIEAAKINIQEAPTTFYDVLPGSWHEKYIGFARTEKIVEGYKNLNGEATNLFYPDLPISRGQVCKIAFLIQQYKQKL